MRQVTLKDGNFVNIFRPRAVDAEEIMAFLKLVGGETNFLLLDSTGLHMSVEEEQDFLEDIYAAERSALYVASLGGKIVGTCSIMFSSNARTAHVGKLGISVARSAWGLGIGTALMETAAKRARSIGAHKIELEVYATNTRAIALYEKLGYTYVGRKKDHLFVGGEYIDELVMELML